MRLRVLDELADDERERWSEFLDQHLGGPQQLPDFVQWWDGLVPDAAQGGFCVLEHEGEWLGCGSFYRRRTAEGSEVEFPRGPVAAREHLPEFLGLIREAFDDESVVVSPYAPRDEWCVRQVARFGYKPASRRWIRETVRLDLQSWSETELFQSFNPATRRRIRSAQRAGASVDAAVSDEECA